MPYHTQCIDRQLSFFLKKEHLYFRIRKAVFSIGSCSLICMVSFGERILECAKEVITKRHFT